jgi:hypothetical protein
MRLIRRFLLPLLFKKAGEKIFKDMDERMRGNSRPADTRREGEVRVDKKDETKSSQVEEGEYVEYEEIKG